MGLLAFSPHTPLPVGPLPLAQPSAADLGDPRADEQLPGGFRGCQYLLGTETQLWLKSYRCAYVPLSAKPLCVEHHCVLLPCCELWHKKTPWDSVRQYKCRSRCCLRLILNDDVCAHAEGRAGASEGLLHATHMGRLRASSISSMRRCQGSLRRGCEAHMPSAAMACVFVGPPGSRQRAYVNANPPKITLQLQAWLERGPGRQAAHSRPEGQAQHRAH